MIGSKVELLMWLMPYALCLMVREMELIRGRFRLL